MHFQRLHNLSLSIYKETLNIAVIPQGCKVITHRLGTDAPNNNKIDYRVQPMLNFPAPLKAILK